MRAEQPHLYDIYGIYHLPFWQTRLFYLLVASVIFLFVFFGVWRGIKMRRAKKLVKRSWQVAMDELRKLERQQILDRQMAQEFYLSLTAIMKRYLQDRYGYQVVGKTDDELLMMLPSIHFPKNLIPGLEVLFRGSVEIKFAQGLALSAQAQQDLFHAMHVVQETMLRDH